jgi:hypothetical protein
MNADCAINRSRPTDPSVMPARVTSWLPNRPSWMRNECSGRGKLVLPSLSDVVLAPAVVGKDLPMSEATDQCDPRNGCPRLECLVVALGALEVILVALVAFYLW